MYLNEALHQIYFLAAALFWGTKKLTGKRIVRLPVNRREFVFILRG